MPKGPLSPAALTLLRQPNPAVIASVRPDGHPVTVATWYLIDDDTRVLVNMDAERKRNEYMRTNPHLSLTALKFDDWTTHISVQGHIVEWRDDVDFTDIDRLSMHYAGRPYDQANKVRARISAYMEIDRWHGWGAGTAMGAHLT